MIEAKLKMELMGVLILGATKELKSGRIKYANVCTFSSKKVHTLLCYLSSGAERCNDVNSNWG